MSFSESLKNLRIQKGLSQQKLAELSGVSQTAIYHWEKGLRKPKFEQIRYLAAALGVYICELEPDWSFYGGEVFEDGIPLDELKMLQDYRILNDNGKDEARKRVNELTEIPKYQKKDK